MTQTILNLKLQSTNENLTPRTGVAILGEYLKGMNLETLCNDNLPKAKHNNGYSFFHTPSYFPPTGLSAIIDIHLNYINIYAIIHS